MSKLNHFYNAERIFFVYKCIRNGGIRYQVAPGISVDVSREGPFRHFGFKLNLSITSYAQLNPGFQILFSLQ